MWVKVEDAWLIAMLEAMPKPWPEAAILAWLTYATRCCAAGQSYWLPVDMSDRAHAKAQKGELVGRSALVKMTGCGRKTARTLLGRFSHRQGQGSSKGPARVQQGSSKGPGSSPKTSTTTDRHPRQGSRWGPGGVQVGSRWGPGASTVPDESTTDNLRNADRGLPLDKSREEKKNKRGPNLAIVESPNTRRSNDHASAWYRLHQIYRRSGYADPDRYADADEFNEAMAAAVAEAGGWPACRDLIGGSNSQTPPPEWRQAWRRANGRT